MLTRQQMLDVLRSGGSIGLPDGRHVLSEADLPPEEDLAALLRRMSGHYTRGASRADQAGNKDEAARLQDMARSYDLMAADRDAESVEEIERRQAELETRKQRVLKAQQESKPEPARGVDPAGLPPDRSRQAGSQDAPQGPQDAPGSTPDPEKAPGAHLAAEATVAAAPPPEPALKRTDEARPGRFGRRTVGEE